jgi:hypothetical protein
MASVVAQGGSIWERFLCRNSTYLACPATPSNSFVLPGPVSVYADFNKINYATGLRLIDINDDNLPDVVIGQADDNSEAGPCYACIYINTHCGWVLQVRVDD